MKKKITLDKLLIVFISMVILLYIGSIFAINIGGRGYINYDMYSDAILAKYIATEKTLFPDGWHFGNQIYTVATPVIASIFYFGTDDSYLALALASCFMTILCIVSFLWCVRPFAKPLSIVPALLVLIGGTNISFSAHGDIEGLQVFYTMASYYSCYVIGIFTTLGAYYRYRNEISVNIFISCGILALNFALGMQSLRETLVLNLPLLAISLFEIIFNKISKQKITAKSKRSILFMSSALLANIGGVITNHILVSNRTIIQNNIIKNTSQSIPYNIISALNALKEYIGFVIPQDAFLLFKLMTALFSTIIVATAFIFVLLGYSKHKHSAISNSILFFIISLIAVFLAGTFFIILRPIYYFCWYLLVSLCVIYLIELEWKNHKKLLIYLKRLLIVGILCISLANYISSFINSFKGMHETRSFYQRIVEQLETDGIKYLYSDWRAEQNVIATISNDEIVYSTLQFSGSPDDLWTPIDYLYMDSWFDIENFDHAYIILTDQSLKGLESKFSAEYTEALMSNLDLVHTFNSNNINIYFYKGTEKMFHDMIE